MPARAGSTPWPSPSRSSRRDHPRSRGEHRDGVVDRMSVGGSSPLARGAHPGRRHPRGRRGIIPARAGSTVIRPSPPPMRGDHPRSRGEHWTIRPSAVVAFGSSPLARGAHDVACGDLGGGRIIPARAGSTRGRAMGCTRTADHPRSRGEHVTYVQAVDVDTGSSPLARGAQGVDHGALNLERIIPARAGSTCRALGRKAARRDHPRSRGEHVHRGAGEPGPEGIIPARAGSTPVDVDPAAGGCGSSPLARGALGGAGAVAAVVGIIPARAGSTKPTPSTPRCRSDHPRSRGEHTTVTTCERWDTGSSPLARGARDLGDQVGNGDGIIPARAGSTRRRTSPSCGRRDHPRSRGEHQNTFSAVPGAAGSSPLARGAQAQGHRRASGERIIPARAGSTLTDLRTYQDDQAPAITSTGRRPDQARHASCGAFARSTSHTVAASMRCSILCGHQNSGDGCQSSGW